METIGISLRHVMGFCEQLASLKHPTPRHKPSLPTGSIVVPFWDYLEDPKYKPPKGTTMEAIGRCQTAQ